MTAFMTSQEKTTLELAIMSGRRHCTTALVRLTAYGVNLRIINQVIGRQCTPGEAYLAPRRLADGGCRQHITTYVFATKLQLDSVLVRLLEHA
ncbi:hypothetical protein DOTSEDRAFT_71178 [Dothistroma septosporum NZE10]|uniref:Uncharacterized protein n=1 Tax=Dothistroma septosporum (strain NZE10 / CBS 128990) TaxID=675120 RepID=N1PSL5_DOTSN|nr:hypothetical protein DOTSEDRAFT_71178 [Dothistroma septosporum NZE10]